MKKSLVLFPLLLIILMAGCSKDDNSVDDGDGDDILISRLVADTLSAAPSTLDANDPVWADIDSTEVQIGFTETYGQNSQLFKDTLLIKAILTEDMIFIWTRWKDPTTDIWGNYSRKSGGVGLWEHITLADAGGGEDALMIIFDAGDNGDEKADCASMCHAVAYGMATSGGGHVDAWCWKSAKIAPAHLAEDQWWGGTGNFLDPPASINPQRPYEANWSDLFDRPIWMHEDDTTFKGPYLYVEDAIEFDGNPYIGWDSASGYKMPGHLIDTNIYSLSSRDDRWNVLAASDYDSISVPHYWTVVLSRTLAPASSSDVDLQDLDSIQISLAVSSDHTYGEDPQFRDHSGAVPFYIIFPKPAPK